MLHLVTGRSGSGKTTYVRKVLGTLASQGEDRLLLIVPEQYSFASERAILEQFGERTGQNIEVLSFTRLADYVFREEGGMAGTPADEGTKIILMLKALQGVQDQLELYRKHVDSVSLANELLHTISELKQAGISPSLLKEAAGKEAAGLRKTLQKKMQELYLIYAAYDAEFSLRYTDDDLLLTRLFHKLRENAFFSGYTIAVDGFKGFTGQELQVLEQLLLQCDNVYLTLCLDKVQRGSGEPAQRDPSLIFESVNDTAKKVLQLAREHQVPVFLDKPEDTGLEQGLRFESNALKVLEQNLFYPITGVYEEDTEDIHIHVGQDLFEECNFIAATIRKLLREEHFRLNDIAVIVRNEEDYRRELQSAFRRYQIPYFEDSRQPVQNQPVIALTGAVFTLLTSGFTTEHLLRYCKTGLSELSDEDVAKLENYALLWNLDAKAWTREFTLHPDGLGVVETEQSKTELEHLNELRTKVVLPLVGLREKVKDATAEDISKAYYDFLLRTHVPQHLKQYAIAYHEAGFTALAAEQDRIWSLLMSILDKLATVMGDRRIPVRTYQNLLNAVVAVTDIGNIPQALDQVTIGAADRIRLSSPAICFVAGLAEGVFPALPHTSGIFNAADRKALLELGLELSLPDELKACEERYIAYTAVTAASQRVYLSYHRIDGPGVSLEPSVVIRSVKALFGDHVTTTEAGLLPVEYYAETGDSTFTAYADSRQADRVETSPETVTLRAVLEEQPGMTGKLYALDKVAEHKPFQIQDRSIATALFGQNMGLTASRVDVYEHCAFQYFCKFGLNAKPRETAKLDPAKSGTVIHYVLEQIIKCHTMDGLIEMTREQRNESVDILLDIYVNEQMGGLEDKAVRFRYLYERLKLSLYDIVDRLVEEFKVSDFRPVDFELSIGPSKEEGKESIPSYRLELDDGGTLEIYGSIDRVDTFVENGTTYVRVVDYKTGGKTFKLSDVLYGLNMQMLIYLFSVEAGGQERYTEDIKPAGIFYYPAKRNTVSMTSRSMMKEKIDSEKVKVDRGNGLFLLDETTLKHMEHDLTNRFIPVKFKKDNSLYGNLITAYNMGQLRKKVDTILTEMAQSLHTGNIEAKPAKGGNYEMTCQFCDYASVCRFQEDHYKEIQDLNEEEIFELLSGKEENN